MSKLTLKRALEETGFVLCEFKSDGDDCECCNKPIKKGGNVYFLRADYLHNEGTYFCSKCVIKRAEENRNIIIYDCPECGDKTQGWIGHTDNPCFDCFCDKETRN